MSTVSNLYAEKVFSEHPLCLWALDDKADYISLITEQKRNVSQWNVIGGTASIDTSILDEPFPNSVVTKLVGEGYGQYLSDETELVLMTCVSNNITNFSLLNKDMATFSIGGYFYANTPYVDGIEIGYEYYDVVQGETVRVLRSFNTTVSNRWIFVSETFDVPSDETDFRVVIQIRYLSSEDVTDPYEFYINGITVGQWSEEFNSTSLGSSPELLPTNILGANIYGIKARAYGLQESNGYYLINNNSLMARNTGVPMVYGASNVSFLYPNNTLPSLIVPGKGFLNEVGKHKDYTVEMWIRLSCDSELPKRIFGPIGSTDGIYVEGPFITLKINDNIASHYIGEWSRPMLVHIKITKNFASMLINGEQVISLELITDNLVFPQEYSGNMHKDWLGFYSYSDVSPFEVDAVAIYPYQVSPIVAKRRFVYGQGVEFPENINSAYSGTSVYVDYSFADYTNNYSYPDIGSWKQGAIENLIVENNTLMAPNYELPELVLTNITEDQFFDYNLGKQLEDNNLITFNSPNGLVNGYLSFPNLNLLTQDTKAIYGVFKVLSIGGPQTLILIENDVTKDYFEIELTATDIRYKLKIGSNVETLYQAFGYDVGEIFGVGVNFENFANFYGAKVAQFFGNKNQLKVYIGGNRDLNKTFSGNIYRIGFSNESDYQEISHLFNSYGVTLDYENVFDLFQRTQEIEYDAGREYFANNGSYYGIDSEGNPVLVPNLAEYWDYVIHGGRPQDYLYIKLIEHTSSYTLIPKIYYNKLILDIAISGTWQDNIPLTYFAQYVTDAKGKRYYDLDFLQFNIDYPAPSKFVESESISEEGWDYSELISEYSNPIQRTYESLDNHLYTGYMNYEDLKQRSIKKYNYDTSGSLVKTDITFQYTETGANAPDSYFVNDAPTPKIGIVEPNSNWMNTRYEVVNNTLIYPPSLVSFEDISIVTTVRFNVPGIITNPVKVRKLEFASQAFNKDTSNPVGTRFGTPMYPYRKAGLYFDYKGRNPFTIYKSSTPYLYMTRYSGIQLRGQYDPLVNRGISIPINQTKATDYKVMAMQLAVRYDEDFFPYAPTQIFEIQSKNSTIKFYMVATHPDGTRAKIYAINANTGRIENGIGFYLNGLIVKEPTINIKQWSFIGISFATLLDFNSYRGAFRVNGPLMINVLSHYQATALQEVQTVSKRPWFRVKNAPPLTLDWQFWDRAYVWQGVLVLSTLGLYGVDPSDIYKTYTGTNKIVIDDTRVFSLKNYEYFVIKDVSWQSNTVSAV